MDNHTSPSSSLTDNHGLSAFSTILQEGWSPYFLLILIPAYLCVIALLRHDRLRTTLENFPYTTRRSFASMTDNDAYNIKQAVAELEFPFMFEKALQFSLFRTYGVPSVSKLLIATSELSDPSTACKRYTDTDMMIREFICHPPTSQRTLEAIARMNFLHSGYRQAGKILDDDMLYTLGLFAIEPVKWIDNYEWRKLEDFEKCAIGTLFKSVGDSMGIDYDNLKSAREGWVDGLQWLEEMIEWSEEYEQRAMVPHEQNKVMAEETTRILLWDLPEALKPIGRHAVSVLMGDRLRHAMM